jgi:two-component system cell cycle response regulator
VKVLIAEDEAVSRVRLQALLTKWGYEVTVARDGLEAWDLLHRPDAPSLAVLDWMMPGLDGTELCRRIRQQGREPYVYVLLLTGRGRKEDLIEGLEAGADDYITKPVDPQELEVRMRSGQRIVKLHAELVASRQAMWFQATHDALTGALNRAAAMDALRREMARAERERAPFAIALVDLDHFKRVNDTHGHPGGDLVLKEGVRRMGEALRPYDLLARFGGEEFLLILPGCDGATAAVVAERVRSVVAERPMALHGHELRVTCSVGVSTAEPGMDLDALIFRADEALYEAKRAGRDRVAVTRGVESQRAADAQCARHVP